MKFNSKQIIHNKGKRYEVSEVIAKVEFSEGDLVELRKALIDSQSEWGVQLYFEINKALNNETKKENNNN